MDGISIIIYAMNSIEYIMKVNKNGKPYFVDIVIDGNTIVLKWMFVRSSAEGNMVNLTVSNMGLHDVTNN